MGLAAGTRLGSYEVVGPLGAGAMGAVYRARDSRLCRSVAIKVISERALLMPGALRRFEQEARAASAIAHPNIVTVHEIGQVEGAPFIVMELVEGKSLRRLLAEGALPPKTLLDIATQVGDGLAATHARGIIHRDLKPENVMVTLAGVVKILDLGLARSSVPSGQPTESTVTSPVRMTEPGMIVGTVSYMSPEQARGADLDFRTDQFSFGAVLYEMVTGRAAFKRDSGAETLTAIIREEPHPVRDLAPASPVPLRCIIERCLAKQREHRYDSTRDLARELQTLKDHASEIGAPGLLTVEAPSKTRRGPGKEWIAAMAVLAIIAASAIGLALKWREQKLLPTFRRLTLSGSRPLGISPAWICGVSDTGEIAFRITKNDDDLTSYFTGTPALVPLSGGTPRGIRKLVTSADITRHGTALAVVAVDLGTAGQTDLEYPLGKKLATGTFLTPRISPDGSLVVAVQDIGASEGLAIVTVDRQGGRRVLSKGRGLALSPVWSPGGDEAEALSPDAKWAFSRRTDEPTKLHLLPIGPKEARTLDLGLEYGGFVGWSSDGDHLFFLGAGEDRLQGLYELTLSTGKSVRIGPKKLFLGLLSPDEKTVLGCEETPEKFALFPLDGEPARPVPGWEAGLFPLAWDPDGRAIFVTNFQDTGRILRLRLQDGHSEPWKEIRPASTESISVGGHSKISAVVISPATGAYAYSYERVASELYLVEGLK